MISQRRMLVMVFVSALTVAGCASNSRHSNGPLATGDELISKIQDDRCIPKIGVGMEAKYEADCKLMTEPRRWRGIWRVEFEGSTFTPEGQENCYRRETPGDCTWLEGKALPWPGRWACAREFEIEFIGRRNVWPGSYGHGGISYYKIVVDRLISAKRLPDPMHDPSQCNPSSAECPLSTQSGH